MGVRTSLGAYGEQKTMTIIYNGVKMTTEQYREMVANKKKENKPKRKKLSKTEVQLITEYVVKLVKDVKVLKSLGSYYKNGYRQWGTICRDNIINHKFISSSFLKFQMASYDMHAIMEDITKLGKYNEKDVFQFIEKLSYKIDDIRNSLNALVQDVEKSRVCETYKEYECINGEGRRLGLSILMVRAMLSMNTIEKLYQEIKDITYNGLNPMEYNHMTSKRIYKHGYAKMKD